MIAHPSQKIEPFFSITTEKDDPDLTRFRFRAQTSWTSEGYSKTMIQGFYRNDIEDISQNRVFIVEGDEPPVLYGKNAGPDAVESVLYTLASCLTGGILFNARTRGIKIEALNFKLEGDIGLQGFSRLQEEGRPDYRNVRLIYRVKSDAQRDQIMELCEYVQRTLPVLNTILNPVKVALIMEN